MRSPWRAAIIAFCVCALGAITPLYAQSGVREARSPLREPYQPTLGSNVARSGSQPAGAVRVAIVGAIAAPGTYQASGGIALPDLFRAAGGMIDQATDNLLLIRGGRIHGPFLLQNGTVATPGELSLIDGDVVVVRARRGVRTLLYQTLAPGADGVPMRSSVDNAARMDFVYVACLGLTDYPVVLPLNPQQATTDTLLLNLLGMSPETVATAVKRVGEAATPLDQRMLTDGTVLLIDPRQVPPGGLRPVEPFPPPRPIPDQSTEQTSPEEVAPGAYDPEPVTGASIDASLRPVSGGYRLTDPLPGFQPFVVEDRPSDQNFSPPEPDVHVQRPIQVDRGHDPVDVTTRRGPRPQLTPPSLSSGSQFSSDRQRSEAALSQVAMQAIREAPPAVPVESPLAFSDASEEDSTLSTAAPQVAVGGRIDLTVILGTAVAAVLCLLASYL
ncbi:MAG: SLBB domain-containing protein, partial [Planctomycetaceae bacterium]|nr:SLBB domain-containing protein [Planctomycetaceae bacterium]